MRALQRIKKVERELFIRKGTIKVIWSAPTSKVDEPDNPNDLIVYFNIPRPKFGKSTYVGQTK